MRGHNICNLDTYLYLHVLLVGGFERIVLWAERRG